VAGESLWPASRSAKHADVGPAGWEDRHMGLSWFGTLIDCDDPERLASFWGEALGYVVVYRSATAVAVAADADTNPGLMFVRVADVKHGKNRLHLDLRPDDQGTEVDRLLALGATRADIGQGEVPWVVLADPEGNEFCVL
jgi:hypothetical protein